MSDIVFLRGVSENRDFEALGRYVDASERIDKLLSARHNLGSAIAQIVRPLSLPADKISIPSIDIDALAEQVSNLTVIESELRAAIDDANQYAEAAGKKAVRRL